MGSSLTVGFCYSRLREDERLLLDELESRGHAVERVDVRDPQFGLDGPSPPDVLADVDVAINRCQESSRVRYVSKLLDEYGVNVLTSSPL